MATYVKFQDFSEQLTKGVHNFTSGAQTFKLALTNSAPSASANTQLSDITQISAQNGYSSGGSSVANVSESEANGTTTVVGDQVVFAASGGSFGPFQYVVLYNDTATDKNLIAYWDYGSAVTLNDGETFTVKFNNTASAGTIFTLA